MVQELPWFRLLAVFIANRFQIPLFSVNWLDSFSTHQNSSDWLRRSHIMQLEGTERVL